MRSITWDEDGQGQLRSQANKDIAATTETEACEALSISLKWLTYAEKYVEVPQTLGFKHRLLLGPCSHLKSCR